MILLFLLPLALAQEDGVMLPSKCEVCKYLALELTSALEESGKSHQTIETAQGRVKKYRDSELRLVETLENLCERIGEYSVHKERPGSARFSREESQTMRTLHNLVNKGVNVDLGIPYELWDSPSVEVTELKRRCELILEELDEDIEDWFNADRATPLMKYLCEDRTLAGEDQSCLYEEHSVDYSDGVKGDRGEL